MKKNERPEQSFYFHTFYQTCLQETQWQTLKPLRDNTFFEAICKLMFVL